MKFFVYIILLFALPVMAYAQRTKNSCYSKSEKLIASYCSPEEQEKLYDSENENSRQRTGIQQGLKSQRESVDTPNSSVGRNDYELFQNGKSIIIQYNGDTSNGIYAVLSDTSGIIYRKSNVSVSSSFAVDCSGLRPADYVLYLYVANKYTIVKYIIQVNKTKSL